jgi:hypothetical protein
MIETMSYSPDTSPRGVGRLYLMDTSISNLQRGPYSGRDEGDFLPRTRNQMQRSFCSEVLY